jgi:hypothetical protein
MCTVCLKGVCRECVARDLPRLICRTCLQQPLLIGFEYRSKATIAGWPLVHICTGVDPVTMRPRIAKGSSDCCSLSAVRPWGLAYQWAG